MATTDERARFDWREFETEARRDHWPPLRTERLSQRYEEGVIGRDAWRRLLESVALLEHAHESDLFGALAWFYEKTSEIDELPARPCVFVSHQRADTKRGERVACLAAHYQVNYWLDVHDPTLRQANHRPLPPALRSIVIAAAVEIGLLNSTHVIALHTGHSLSSKWVPYELARAKPRRLRTWEAAGWFEAGQSITQFGEYVLLASQFHDEPAVEGWLTAIHGSSPVPPLLSIHPGCGQHATSTLA